MRNKIILFVLLCAILILSGCQQVTYYTAIQINETTCLLKENNVTITCSKCSMTEYKLCEITDVMVLFGPDEGIVKRCICV